jgi:uncharacterized OB-fold protein
VSASGVAALANADSQPYWDAARAGKLAFKTCLSCGHRQFPPRQLCPVCWSDRFEWREHRGRGRVYSFAIVHRAPLADFEVPYVLALVELEDGPRMMTNIVGAGALEVGLGEAVEVTFEERGGAVLPMFRRCPEADGAKR